MMAWSCLLDGVRMWPMQKITKSILKQSISKLLAVDSFRSFIITNSTHLSTWFPFSGIPKTDLKNWTELSACWYSMMCMSRLPHGIPKTLWISPGQKLMDLSWDSLMHLLGPSTMLMSHVLNFKLSLEIAGRRNMPPKPISTTSMHLDSLNVEIRAQTFWREVLDVGVSQAGSVVARSTRGGAARHLGPSSVRTVTTARCRSRRRASDPSYLDEPHQTRDWGGGAIKGTRRRGEWI